ncbi:type IV secretory system conjugative DNA transfer family protein [Priestia megaterium]|uniref:VirD4-like conjugal transfer protein, CD1115 family n=1 Tax=Priestia megaterium TaxID=1404 RepID=UPI003000AE07
MKFDKKKLIKSAISNGLIVGATDYTAVSGREYLPKYLQAIPSSDKVGALTDSFIHDWLADPAHVLATAANQTHSLPIQLGAAALFLGLFAKDAWNARKHKVEKASEYGAYGTADFLTEKQIKADTKDFALDLKTPGHIIGMVKGKPVIHHEKSFKNRNVLIFGASGTQKSKSYIIPNILNTDSDSIIVTDAKGELFRDTSEAKRKQGYKVHFVSFVLNEHEHSDKYNPLDYIETDIDAAELANTLVINGNGVPANGDSFWVNSEAGLIATLVLYTKYFLPKEQQNLGTVYNLLATNPATLYKLFKDIPESHIVKRSYNGSIGNKEDKMKDQIIGGASTAMDLWKYDEARHLTCQSDFNLQDIGKEKTIVYIRIPVGKKYSRPLISTFFVQMFDQLYALGERNESGELNNPVRLLLDEFCNIGTIPMFEEKLSTTRGYKIYVSPVVQSLEQLRDRYGREKASEIMDNCDIHMLLGTNDKDAQKHFSEKLGTTTVRIQSESETKNDRGDSQAESLNYAQRSLLTADEVNRLPDDRLIIFMRTKQAFMLEKAFYTKLQPIADMLGNKKLIRDYEPPEVKPYSVFEPVLVVAKKEKREKKNQNVIEEIMETVEMEGLQPEQQDSSKEKPKTLAVKEKVKSKEEALIDSFDI